MPWRLTSDVEEYAEHTWDLLTASPAEHTIPLTVLERVREGRRWSDEPMLFGWFEDGAEVRGAVFRTPPFELLLAVVPEEATAAATGVGGIVTVIPDIAAAAWIQSRMVFFIAAA